MITASIKRASSNGTWGTRTAPTAWQFLARTRTCQPWRTRETLMEGGTDSAWVLLFRDRAWLGHELQTTLLWTQVIKGGKSKMTQKSARRTRSDKVVLPNPSSIAKQLTCLVGTQKSSNADRVCKFSAADR